MWKKEYLKTSIGWHLINFKNEACDPQREYGSGQFDGYSMLLRADDLFLLMTDESMTYASWWNYRFSNKYGDRTDEILLGLCVTRYAVFFSICVDLLNPRWCNIIPTHPMCELLHNVFRVLFVKSDAL